MNSENLSLKTITNDLDLLNKAINTQFENKDFLFLAYKLIEKILDSRNAKKHYQSFIRKKNKKSVKQIKIIFRLPKTFENPYIADTKSVISEHPKTSYELSKTMRQVNKVSQLGSNSS